MVKRLIIILQSLAIAAIAMAQTSFISDDSIAVYYPAGYEAKQHQPSPIFVREPLALSPLPADWRLKVVFSQNNGKQIATIHTGTGVDLYGTGEVTVPL